MKSIIQIFSKNKTKNGALKESESAHLSITKRLEQVNHFHCLSSIVSVRREWGVDNKLHKHLTVINSRLQYKVQTENKLNFTRQLVRLLSYMVVRRGL